MLASMYTHTCVCVVAAGDPSVTGIESHMSSAVEAKLTNGRLPHRETQDLTSEHWVVWPRALVSLFTVKGFTPVPVCIRNGALALRCGVMFKEFAGVLASLHSRSRSLFRPPLPQRKQAAAVLPHLLYRALG